MAKGEWWFKFEYGKWDDSELKKCRMETQGFWLRVYAHFRQTDTFKISETVEDLARMFSCTTDEVERSIADLKKRNAATVTVCNAKNVTCNKIVTLVSRERKKALTIREQTRLRVEAHRKKRDGNAPVIRQSKSKSKSKEEEEKKRTPIGVPKAAAEPLLEIHLGTVLAGVKKELGILKLTASVEREWINHSTLAFENGFTAQQVVECFTILRQKHDYKILPQYVSDQLPDLGRLRKKHNQDGERLPTAAEKDADAISNNAAIRRAPKTIGGTG